MTKSTTTPRARKAPAEPRAFLLPGASATALQLPSGLTFAQWQRHGHALGRIDRGIGWWVGDWLLYGEHHYGEGYAQPASEIGLAPGTLQNYQWVASRFTPERRRDKLTFGHHQVVAAMEPAQQDKWLDLAEQELWSATTLREAIVAAKEKETGGSKATSAGCARCAELRERLEDVLDVLRRGTAEAGLSREACKQLVEDLEALPLFQDDEP